MAKGKLGNAASFLALFALLAMQLIDFAAFDFSDDYHNITPEYIENLHTEDGHAENRLMSKLHVSFHSMVNVYLFEDDVTLTSREIVRAPNNIRRDRINLNSGSRPPVPPPLA